MQLLSNVKKSSGDKKMKKILLENDILVIDGKEFSYNQLTGYLTERLILKKQLQVVKDTNGGVTHE